MRLNSKLTWGLAWAGLAIVVAVPSADFFTGKVGGKAAMLTSTVEPGTPIKTASVTTTVTDADQDRRRHHAGRFVHRAVDPVPSYLSTDGQAAARLHFRPRSATSQAPRRSHPRRLAGAGKTPTQVATIDPAQQVVAPVPLPGRPAELDAQPKVFTPQPAAAPAGPVLADNSDVNAIGPDASSAAPIVDESSDEPQVAEAPPGPVPPEPINDGSADAPNGNLQQYLSRNGLLDNGSADEGGRSTAQVTVTDQPNSDYDAQGFYLNDGPNNPHAAARRRRFERLLDGGDAPDFTLF